MPQHAKWFRERACVVARNALTTMGLVMLIASGMVWVGDIARGTVTGQTAAKGYDRSNWRYSEDPKSRGDTSPLPQESDP